MVNISPETSKRHVYIDKKVSATLDTLSDPVIQRALSGYAPRFAERLETAVVANIENGIVKLPDTKSPADAMAVIALHHGETVQMDNHFFTQTNPQKERTIQLLSTWEPFLELDTTYNFVFRTPPESSPTRPSVALSDLSLAMTGTSVNIISEHNGREDWFGAAPPAIILLRHRPVLIIGMENEDKIADSEILHELGHVEEADRNPVIIAQSQHSLDMFSLGEELHASAIGAAVASVRLQRSKRTSADEITKDSGFSQLSLEFVRREYVGKYGLVDKNNPYRPSGMLLKMVREAGLSSLLHQTLNYEEINRLANPEQTD